MSQNILDDKNENKNFRPWGMDINIFCVLMHIAQYAGYIVPLAGWILPIMMWATNKDKSDLIDKHGINIINWMISCLIYAVLSTFLIIFIVGIFALWALLLCSLIFTILAAVKAANGEVYKYPLAIEFIKQ